MNLLLPPLCLRLQGGKVDSFHFEGWREGSKNLTWNWSLSRQILILSTEEQIIRSNFTRAGRNLCAWQPSLRPHYSLPLPEMMISGYRTEPHPPSSPLLSSPLLSSPQKLYFMDNMTHLLKKPSNSNHLLCPLRGFSCWRLAVHSKGAGWKDGTAACTTRSRQLPPV